MKPKERGGGNSVKRNGERDYGGSQDGLHWAVILGGTIVSTLAVAAGHKLKQAFQANRQKRADCSSQKEDNRSKKRASEACPLSSNICRHDGGVCAHCVLGSSYGPVEMKLDPQVANFQFENIRESIPIAFSQKCKLSEVQIHSEGREDSPLWSPEQLELPNGNLLLSHSSESVCTSETGSENFGKRDLVIRLREQLKKRDEMILEMQTQINDQLKIINNQISHITNLQSRIDLTNRDIFESEREIQHLRKVIADHCVGYTRDSSFSGTGSIKAPLFSLSNRSMVDINGGRVELNDMCDDYFERNQQQISQQHGEHPNSSDVKVWKLVEDLQCFSLNKNNTVSCQGRSPETMVDLEKEIAELKQSLNAKNYLLEVYEKQRLELCSQLKDLQGKLGVKMSTISV